MQTLIVDGHRYYWEPHSSMWLTGPYRTFPDADAFHVTTYLNQHHITPDDIRIGVKAGRKYRWTCCIACGKPLDVVSKELMTCGREDCLIAVEEILVGNPVTRLVSDFPVVSTVHLYLATKALQSDDALSVVDPFPLYFLKDGSDYWVKRGSLAVLSDLHHYHDIERLRSLLPTSLNDVSLSSMNKWCQPWMSSVIDDAKLRKTLGEELYRWIRFVLLSGQKHRLTTLALPSHLHNNEAIWLAMSPTPIEDETYQGDLHMLFHGSRIDRWYSILRNGLQTLSKTVMQTHGHVHGAGIYLTNQLKTAQHYAMKTVMDPVAVGVFSTKQPIINYAKSAGIYVVKSNDEVFLRGLVLIPSKHSALDKMEFDFNTYTKTWAEHWKQPSGSSSMTNVPTSAPKRLVKEWQSIQSQTHFPIQVTLVHDQLLHWHVLVPATSVESSLASQLTAAHLEGIELEVLFSPQYPHHPPFIRIVKPRFQPQTGHITSGGSICMDILCPQHWRPTLSIENLLLQIVVTISEGHGKIDPTHRGYSMSEAQEAFTRVAKSHGWM